MKIKRYTITENKKINNDYLKKYVTENDISQNEIAKIQIERPSEIIVFQDEAGKMAGSLNLWHNRPDYNEKKTSYIGNVMIFEKYRKEEFEKKIFDELFEELKKDGIELIIGPLNGTTWNTYRYVTKTGNRKPFLMEPWNEGYYVELFQKTGFNPLANYISTIMENMNPVKRENLSKKIEKIKKSIFFYKVPCKPRYLMLLCIC